MNTQRLSISLLGAGLLLWMAGCTSTGGYPPPPSGGGQAGQPGEIGTVQPAPEAGPEAPESTPAQPGTPSAPPQTMADVSGPAVLALIKRADQRMQAGEADSAAAALERALDIEPRNPFIYQRLAAVRLEQGQPGQAEALARKSNSLAGDNPLVKGNNWRIIAQTRSARGDSVGASAANSRVQYYQGQAGNRR